MLFNTAQFAAFFALFYIAFYFVAKRPSEKLWLVAIASLYFYASWNWKFVFLLVGTGAVDYYIAQAIDSSADPRRRKRLLTMSVVMNLGVLALFKYSNFVLANIGSFLATFHAQRKMPIVDIVLPVGISFYTFQSISYTVDVYRGVFKPRQRLMEFLASLTFFPHLVAGPIVRSSMLLPQFSAFHSGTLAATRIALLNIAAGLTKKTLADLVAPQVETVFGSTGPLSMGEAWAGALGFTAQIYGDFSGYTDIAIGVSLMLGFTLPKNFDLPYLATSPTEFWRRWHISLSSWLRDYLYIPLGGNRLGAMRTRINLMLTMLLGGLWHGASWTFVLWGLYHGCLLAGTQALTPRGPQPTGGATWWSRLSLGIKLLLTFYLTVIGWVLFRGKNVASVMAVLRGMHAGVQAPSLFWPGASPRLAFAVGVIVLCHAVDYLKSRKEAQMLRPVTWCIAVLIGVAVPFLLGGSGNQFIYFQF